MFKTINEELYIMSCGVDDLTNSQKVKLVDLINGNDIKTLAIFYDQENDMIVLNHDHDNFEFNKIFAEKFYLLNSNGRSKLRQNIERFQSCYSLMEMFNVLHSIYWIRKYKQEEEEARKIREILKQQSVEAYRKNVPIIEALRRINTRNSDCFFDWDPFMYGYIQGIRAERARRKKKATTEKVGTSK